MIDGNLLLSVVPETLDESGEKSKVEHQIVAPEDFFGEVAIQLDNLAPLASNANAATITAKVNALIAALKATKIMARDWIITNTLTHITSSDTALVVSNGETYTATLSAAEGYTLPAAITVIVGGEELESGFTYSAETGAVSITAVDGDVEIIAEATETPPSA